MITVLIADRERLFAESLAVALAAPDLKVLDEHPVSGLDAVKATLALGPDVVLIDYWEEGMRGPAAARMILKRAPQVKVILLSWFHTPREAKEAVNSGALEFIPKSAEVAEVEQAIRRAAAHRPLTSKGPGPHPARTRQADPNAWDRLLALTVREIEVLGLLAVHQPETIAEMLSVSLGTVRNHIQNILKKTGARTRLEAVDVARHYGLI